MIKFLLLLMVALTLGAIVAPGVREAVAWVLAGLILVMLGDLILSAIAKLRRSESRTSRHA